MISTSKWNWTWLISAIIEIPVSKIQTIKTVNNSINLLLQLLSSDCRSSNAKPWIIPKQAVCMRERDTERSRQTKRESKSKLWLTTAVQQPGHNVGSSRWIKITATWKRKACIHCSKTWHCSLKKPWCIVCFTLSALFSLNHTSVKQGPQQSRAA